jgi:oxygen-dependent protoporphyrinogen oxidase
MAERDADGRAMRDGRAPRIAVVGAGITGLSAAHHLAEAFRRDGVAAHIAVIEAATDPGGKIRTLRRDGCVIERGPDSFLARKTPILELAEELGLTGELVPVNPAAPARIVRHGRLHPIPDGMQLGIPTKLMPFLKSGLLSPAGKMRALFDLVLPKGGAGGDESIGAFLARRFGGELTRRIAEPLLAGIYAGDLDKLSLLATFPQFRELVERHGSLIRGMAESRRRGRQPSADQQAAADRQAPASRPALPEPLSRAVFLTFRNGLSTLVEALENRLAGVRFMFGEKVVNVRRRDGELLIRLSGGAELAFDAAVIAVPNHEAKGMLESIGTAVRLIDIPYASVANAVLAFRRSETAGRREAGSGFVVPRGEPMTITACTVTSVKWPHASPADVLLVRCYVGRHGDPRGLELSDGELLRAVRADLERMLGIAAEPLFVEITRWPDSMPQYPVGHRERIAAFREALRARLPGVAAAGAGFDGVGLPDCIAQGRRAAEEIRAYLSERAMAGRRGAAGP